MPTLVHTQSYNPLKFLSQQICSNEVANILNWLIAGYYLLLFLVIWCLLWQKRYLFTLRKANQILRVNFWLCWWMVCGFSQSFVDYLFICQILIQYSRRRQWHPTPVLLPGKSHGRRRLVGCSPWGCKESDKTEQLHFLFSLSLFTFMHWRRKWQPTPVFLPGESQGRGSLVGCRLWGRTESDTTEAT